MTIAEPNKKKKGSVLAKTQPVKSTGLSVY